MKRPYISLDVRLAVAERQAAGSSLLWRMYVCHIKDHPNLCAKRRLEILLSHLFKNDPYQLDHDPALSLRKFNERTGRWTPDANDPDYLVYRDKQDHHRKTFGRQPGASRTVTTKDSDVWLKAKYDRLEGRNAPRFKRKIPSRPFSTEKRSLR